MPRDLLDTVQGTVDFMILRALSRGPMHGYSIARWVVTTSGDEMSLEEGTLYPALHRMEDRGVIEATWGVSENNRRAKYYSLTPAGRLELRDRTAKWHRFARMMTRLLEATA